MMNTFEKMSFFSFYLFKFIIIITFLRRKDNFGIFIGISRECVFVGF